MRTLDEETADYLPPRNGFRSSPRHKRIVLILSLVGVGSGLIALVLSLIAPRFLEGESTPGEVDAATVRLPKGTGQEELLSFVPREFTLFAGANLSMLPQQPKWQLPAQMGIAGGLRGLPPVAMRLGEFIGDIERILVAANPEQQLGAGLAQGHPEMLLVLRTKAPYTRERMRELLGVENQPPLQVKDKRVYLVHAEAQATVAMHLVNDRIVVFAVTTEQRLGEVLIIPGAAPVGDDLARTEARAVENALVWTAGAATPAIRGWLTKVDARALAVVAPELLPALGPLQKVKGGAAAVQLTPQGTWSLRVRAICTAAEEAQQLQAACQEFWDKKARMYLNLARMMLPGEAQPALTTLLDQLANNFKVSTQGPDVELTLEVSADVLLQAMGPANGPALPAPALPLPGLPPQFQIPQFPPLRAPGR